MDLKKRFRDFLEREGLKQAYVARSLGVSASQISQWLSDKYRGDVATLEASLKSFIENYSQKNKNEPTVAALPLANYRSAMFVADEAIINQEIAVLYGMPGSGKSVVARAFVAAHPESVFIEVVPGIRVGTLLRKIAEKVSLSGIKSEDELISALSEEFKRRDSVLVIDEAEHLTVKGLESIRRIHDFSSVPVILVGTYGLLKNFKGNNGELLQLYSRAKGRWEFRELDDADMELLFGAHAKVVSKYTRHLRRAVNLYAKAQRFAAMQHEDLNAGHIDAASTMIFLD